MARVSDPRDSQSVQPDQAPSNGKTILLAEDDPFISRMYQVKLEGGGFNVVLANNGRDAYEQIKAVNPDLVMMDVNMPELSGFEVLKALAAEESGMLKRVMVLTNSANPADRKTAETLGVDYIIKAEMTPHEVLNKINQKLSQI